MNAATKTVLVIAFVITAALLLLFGGGMGSGTMMGDGMMGGGTMSGIGWMWPTALLVVVLGAALVFVLFGKK